MPELREGMLFRMEYKKLISEGVITTHGFLVKKGSRMPVLPQREFGKNHPTYAKLRNQLIAEGVVVRVQTDSAFEFARDYEFSTIAVAAAVIRGGPPLRDVWKGPGGKDYMNLLRKDQGWSESEELRYDHPLAKPRKAP